eukprot:symbB.v1.2.008365.t1/scaffold524.1/size192337/14
MGICLSEEYCATSGEDQIVKIWSATTGELLLQLPSEKARSPGVRIKNHQLFVSGANDVSVYSLPQGTLERRLELEASPTSPTSPQSTNAAGTLRSTPMTYPRLALGGSYVVSASEMRVASVWTVLDHRVRGRNPATPPSTVSTLFHRFRLGRTVRSCAPLRTNAESRAISMLQWEEIVWR